LLQLQSWQWAFVECGAAGVLWLIWWRRWFRDLPEEHPAVNEAELSLIRAGRSGKEESHRVPWKTLFTSANLAFICLMYFAYGYGLYFYITWLPTYLLEARGFSVNSTKWLAAAPWAGSALAFWGGGWVTGWVGPRAGGLQVGRGGMGVCGLTGGEVRRLG